MPLKNNAVSATQRCKDKLRPHKEDIYRLYMLFGTPAYELAQRYEVSRPAMNLYLDWTLMRKTPPSRFAEAVVTPSEFRAKSLEDFNIVYCRRVRTEGVYMISASFFEYLVSRIGEAKLEEILDES